MCLSHLAQPVRCLVTKLGVNPKPKQVIWSAQIQAGQRHQSDHAGRQQHGERPQQEWNTSVAKTAGAAVLAYGLWELNKNRKLINAEDQKMIPSLKEDRKPENLVFKTITTKHQKENSRKVKKEGDEHGQLYENRMRQYATPYKTFQYFSSYLLSQKTNFGAHSVSMMMSPMDLFHAVTPEASSGSRSIPVDHDELASLKLEQSPVENSILNQIGNNGLIAYNDFCFLLTLLSTPRRYISTAFHLFDIGGDGVIDAKEFSHTSSKLAYNAGGFGEYNVAAGKHQHIQMEQVDEDDSGLLNHLFGKDRLTTLDSNNFVKFITKLQDEIIELEFREYDTKNTGWITEEDLGHFLVKNVKIPSKLEKRMMNRLKKTWPADHEIRGISLPSFKNLYQALTGGDDLQRAMHFLDQGEGVDFELFHKIIKWVSNQDLSDHVAKVMFVLFDDDLNGKINSEDVHHVLLNWRKARGFEKSIVHAYVGNGGNK